MAPPGSSNRNGIGFGHWSFATERRSDSEPRRKPLNRYFPEIVDTLLAQSLPVRVVRNSITFSSFHQTDEFRIGYE